MTPADPLSVNAPIYPTGSRYEQVARRVLLIEGGLANVRGDRGGVTKYGISLRFLVSEGKIDLNQDGFADFDLDMDGDVDGADIRALTPQQALNLFYRCFWHRLDLDRLPRPIDGAVFDQAVNGGTTAAVRMLQIAANRMNMGFSLATDGQLGRITVARIAQIARIQHGLDKLLGFYREQAEARYNAIVRADRSQVTFLKGWVARARKLGNV